MNIQLLSHEDRDLAGRSGCAQPAMEGNVNPQNVGMGQVTLRPKLPNWIKHV